jgi:D-sedoheptulose 7-phosphate isomerase
MNANAFARDFLCELLEVAQSIDVGAVARLAELVVEASSNGATIFTCGNGGSASTASHFAADLTKYTRHHGVAPIKALSLCDNAPLISAIVNDWGPRSIFVEQMRPHFKAGDMLIVISVHGGSGQDSAGPWSQNLIFAAEFARANGGKVVALTGFGGGALLALSDVSIVVPNELTSARATPIVESLHVAIHHLICDYLLQRFKGAALESRNEA